ncbi:MAG: hypothetical protein ACRDWE_04970 [Acidimicrobiales bacterium]
MPEEMSRLQQLGQMVDRMEARRASAAALLDERPPGQWRFAFLGAVTEPNGDLAVGDVGILRPVEAPPDSSEFLSALRNPEGFGASVYVGAITYELELVAGVDETGFALGIGWSIIAGLRLCSDCEFLVPAAADHSWDTIAGAPEKSVAVELLEHRPMARRVTPERIAITEDQCAWVGSQLEAILKLRADRKFHFALECLSESFTQDNLRLATALLWAGIEGLLPVTTETVFRLASLLASLIEPPSESRYQAYKRIKKLYVVRSKAVHGGELSETQMRSHVLEVRGLLRRHLKAVIARGSVPTVDDAEAALLGP